MPDSKPQPPEPKITRSGTKTTIAPNGHGPHITHSGKTVTVHGAAGLCPKAVFKPISTARDDHTCPCLTRAPPPSPDLDRHPMGDWAGPNANPDNTPKSAPAVKWISDCHIGIDTVQCPVHIKRKSKDQQWVIVVHPLDTTQLCTWLFLGQSSFEWLGMSFFKAKTMLRNRKELSGCGHDECQRLYQKRYIATLSANDMQYFDRVAYEKWYDGDRGRDVTSLSFITEVVAQCTRETDMFGEDVRDVMMELVIRFGQVRVEP